MNDSLTEYIRDYLDQFTDEVTGELLRPRHELLAEAEADYWNWQAIKETGGKNASIRTA